MTATCKYAKKKKKAELHGRLPSPGTPRAPSKARRGSSAIPANFLLGLGPSVCPEDGHWQLCFQEFQELRAYALKQILQVSVAASGLSSVGRVELLTQPVPKCFLQGTSQLLRVWCAGGCQARCNAPLPALCWVPECLHRTSSSLLTPALCVSVPHG